MNVLEAMLPLLGVDRCFISPNFLAKAGYKVIVTEGKRIKFQFINDAKVLMGRGGDLVR